MQKKYSVIQYTAVFISKLIHAVLRLSCFCYLIPIFVFIYHLSVKNTKWISTKNNAPDVAIFWAKQTEQLNTAMIMQYSNSTKQVQGNSSTYKHLKPGATVYSGKTYTYVQTDHRSLTKYAARWLHFCPPQMALCFSLLPVHGCKNFRPMGMQSKATKPIGKAKI